MDGVALVDGYDDRPGLPDRIGDALACLLRPGGEHPFAHGVLRLVADLAPYFLPAEILADARAGGVQTVAGRGHENDGVAPGAGAIRPGRLVDEAARPGARPAGVGNGSRPQNCEVEIAVVLDVARPLGQRVDPSTRRRRALGQAPGPPDLGEEFLLDELRRDAIAKVRRMPRVRWNPSNCVHLV